MSFSREWTEYHLTPSGWQGGSERTDFADTKKPNPPDRVVTERWIEEQTSGYGKMRRQTELLWESEDKPLVKTLRTKFGPSPQSL